MNALRLHAIVAQIGDHRPICRHLEIRQRLLHLFCLHLLVAQLLALLVIAPKLIPRVVHVAGQAHGQVIRHGKFAGRHKWDIFAHRHIVQPRFRNGYPRINDEIRTRIL